MSTRHGLHVYRSDEHLARSAASFARVGLARGDRTLLVPARRHRELLVSELERLGVDVASEVRGGHLVLGDADDLAQGCIEAGTVEEVWRAFAAVLDAAGRRATVWGETPDRLMKAGHVRLYHDLEARWCEAVATTPQLDLLCSYRADPLDEQIYEGELQAACAHHTHGYTAEDAARIEEPVRAALNEVLGSRLTGKALSLADAELPTTAALPPAVRRLLWLYDEMPHTWRKVVANARARTEA